jgi:hypothetical protein
MSQETFERELARRAEDVHGAPLSLEDVRGKAVAIRRRRRAAVAAAVAAVVALVIVVPTVLGGGPGKKSDAPEPAPRVPGHTAVLHDGAVTMPDGTVVDLDVDEADVTQLGVLTDGRIVLAMSKPRSVRVYAPDGSTYSTYPVAYNVITMSPHDDAVAWVSRNLWTQVLTSGASEPATRAGIPMPGEGIGSIDAVLDTGDLLVGDYNTTTNVISPEGAAELSTSEPLRVTDVSPDGSLWAVQYADDSDPQFGCSGLYDPEQDRMVARSCETSGLTFSPDGEHLLGMRGDNDMFGQVETYDLDLRQVSVHDPGDRTVIKDAAWSDSGHLLLSISGVAEHPQWTLVRVATDRSEREVLAGPEPGPNAEHPTVFRLSE